jgi:hypothetical protein
MTHEGQNLSSPAELPNKQGWKVFSHAPVSGPAVVRYPGRSRVLEISYASEEQLAAYWGVWVNTGGWAGYRHFAIEPTTGRFDQIDKSINDKSAGMVQPGGTITWNVTLRVGPSAG